MAEFKRKTLLLSTGKQLKLFGTSLGVSKSLEIGEGYAPNIFSYLDDPAEVKGSATILNPYKLTGDELQEIADYNIRLWMDLKDNIRRHGAESVKVFNTESTR